MSIRLLELLAAHGGIVAVVLGVPYLLLVAAVIALWKSNNKDKERILELVESKVEQDARLEAAFKHLKEIIQQRSQR